MLMDSNDCYVPLIAAFETYYNKLGYDIGRACNWKPDDKRITFDFNRYVYVNIRKVNVRGF